MPLPLVKLHARLGRRQADEIIRHEIVSDLPVSRRSIGHIPRTRRVDCKHRLLRLLKQGDDFVEGFPHWRLEGEAKECIDDKIS